MMRGRRTVVPGAGPISFNVISDALASKSASSRRLFCSVTMFLTIALSTGSSDERKHCISNMRLLSMADNLHLIASSSRPASKDRPN